MLIFMSNVLGNGSGKPKEELKKESSVPVSFYCPRCERYVIAEIRLVYGPECPHCRTCLTDREPTHAEMRKIYKTNLGID